MAPVRDDDRGDARPEAAHQPGRRRKGDGIVAGADVAERRHVGHGRVAECDEHPELHRLTRSLEEVFPGLDFDLLDRAATRPSRPPARSSSG